MQNSSVEEKSVANTGNTNVILTIFDGPKAPYEINLRSFNKQSVTFGRNGTNDIVLESAIVSGFHGYIALSKDECFIYDNGSTNGLYVNGSQITQHKLCDGDTIRIDNLSSPMDGSVSMVFSLRSSGGTWKKIDLSERNQVTIGRSEECDIRINHVTVSRVHAIIYKDKDGFYVADNNSTNGVYIRGRQISGKYRLNEMDVISITTSRFVFQKGCISYKVNDTGIGIDASNVVKTVRTGRNEHNIVSNVSLSIKPCEFVAIIGGSGAGKSSFLKCLCGFSGATEGSIRINGDDLYENYDVLKCVIGYVPQQDIVHGDLTLKRMLTYAAQMRMPKDAAPQEIQQRVAEVISIVELDGKEDTHVRQLSGGQRKRASIAVELLSDPSLFFLDEPTSGLDPGTEKNLMHTLRKMTDKEKTVILVTHNTMNLHLCDKIIFLGYGGRLCFYGSPDEALAFFGVDDFVDIYNIINSDTGMWEEKFRNSQYWSAAEFQGNSNSVLQKAKKNKYSSLKQFIILSKRYLDLVINDKKRLLLLLFQAPFLGLLLALVSDASPNSPFVFMKDANALLFSLSCAAFWVGMLNSIQEICKERTILEREQMANLKLMPYIGSKLFIQGILCLIQSVTMVGTLALIRGLPETNLIMPTFLEIVITTFLAAYCATTLGLVVSALTPNPDRALTIAPLLLMPQILFSGITFTLKGFIKYFSVFVSSNWAMDAYSATAGMKNLLVDSDNKSPAIDGNLFDYVPWDLTKPWLVMGIFIVVSTAISIVALSQSGRE